MNNNSNQISNPMVEVPKTIEMNDENYLNDLLEYLKNMVNNYSYALNEMSNQELYNRIKPIFEETSALQRHFFDLAFQRGWYSLEKAEQQKITSSYQKYSDKLQEMN